MKRLNIVLCANKKVPESDHRLAYSRMSRICKFTFAFPSKPESLPNEEFIPVKIGEGFRFRYLIELFRFICKVSKLEKVQIIHFLSTVMVLFGPTLAKMCRLNSIITITGFGRIFSNTDGKFRLLKKFYLVLLFFSTHNSKRVFFQNHGDMVYLKRLFPSLSWKFYYVGSSVDGNIVKKKGFGNTDLRVLHVGRIMPDKGIEDFLKVAKKLHSKNFNFVLIGPEAVGFNNLASRVIDYQKKGFLTYKGSIPNAMVLKEMENSHIFFFPSYGEGMARVMLECGLAGMCPVAYDINANKDLISDGCGFKVAPGDTNKVVDILSMLHENRNMLEENALAYQEHVVANFSLAGFCERMDQVMAQVEKEL